MTSRDFFEQVREAALDAERTRRQLEAMESPEGVVSFAYYLTDVARAATEPACVLFERGGRRG